MLLLAGVGRDNNLEELHFQLIAQIWWLFSTVNVIRCGFGRVPCGYEKAESISTVRSTYSRKRWLTWVTGHRLRIAGTDCNYYLNLDLFIFTLFTVIGGLCVLMCCGATSQQLKIIVLLILRISQTSIISCLPMILLLIAFLCWCACVKQSINESTINVNNMHGT